MDSVHSMLVLCHKLVAAVSGLLVSLRGVAEAAKLCYITACDSHGD